MKTWLKNMFEDLDISETIVGGKLVEQLAQANRPLLKDDKIQVRFQPPRHTYAVRPATDNLEVEGPCVEATEFRARHHHLFILLIAHPQMEIGVNHQTWLARAATNHGKPGQECRSHFPLSKAEIKHGTAKVSLRNM